MIYTNPVSRISLLVAQNPVRLMPLLNELLPKDKRSNNRDKQAKVISNLPKPDIVKILVAIERESARHPSAIDDLEKQLLSGKAVLE